MEEFAATKYANFVRRYEGRLQAAKLLQRAQETSVQELLVYLRHLQPFWGYLQQRDVDSLIALFEVSDFGDKDAVLEQFRDMRGEELAKFWQYVDLFLELAK